MSVPERTPPTDRAQAGKPARRERRPNAQRSAETRGKLIQATIDCLYEVGYHQTTTVLVAQRAGVSRGAMLHHFPSKSDLVLAAADSIRTLRREEHAGAIGKLQTPREKFLHLIDVLWAAMVSPSGIARLELMMSSRSDPELADRFREMYDDLDRRHKEAVWGLASQLGLAENHRPVVDSFVQLYAAATRGLAIDTLRPGGRAGADAAIELLKKMQVQLLDELLAENDPQQP